MRSAGRRCATGRAGWRARWGAIAGAGVLVAGIGVVSPAAAGASTGSTVAPGSSVGGAPGRPRAVDLTGVESVAWDVNDRGVVVGWYDPEGDDQSHAFRWSAWGGLTDLGPGAAKAINEAGVVVGTRTGVDGLPRATRWTAAGVAQDLDVEGFSWANDVNDRGTIVGYTSLPDSSLRGFVIEPGAAPELLAHPAELGGLSDVAIALDERGTIVGSTLDGELGYQAVTWVGRDHREVDVGPSGVQSLGRAINDHGQVVGIRYNAGDAFRWDPRTGRTTILTGLADVRDEALGINNRGAVVGYSTLADGTQRATLFAPR